MLVDLVALRQFGEKLPADRLAPPCRGQLVISTSMRSHRDWIPNPSKPTTVAVFTPADGSPAMTLLDATTRELTEAGALLIVGMQKTARWEERRQAWACRPALA